MGSKTTGNMTKAELKHKIFQLEHLAWDLYAIVKWEMEFGDEDGSLREKFIGMQIQKQVDRVFDD